MKGEAKSMVFLTKFLPLFLLTNGSFLTTSSSSSTSNASENRDVLSIDSSESPASSSSSFESQSHSSPISLSTHQNNSLLLLSASSSDRFVTVRKVSGHFAQIPSEFHLIQFDLLFRKNKTQTSQSKEA